MEASPPPGPDAEPSWIVKVGHKIGLDPVLLAVVFTVTTPLVPLEVAATLFLSRRIVARMGGKAVKKP
jgi:hypothetical protein